MGAMLPASMDIQTGVQQSFGIQRLMRAVEASGQSGAEIKGARVGFGHRVWGSSSQLENELKGRGTVDRTGRECKVSEGAGSRHPTNTWPGEGSNWLK